MTDYSQILNVLLYDNLLTPEPGDYIGKIQLNGTLYNRNIAHAIVDQRSEFRYETILNILEMADSIKRSRLASGYSVIDGVAQMHPSTTGRYMGKGAQFDPAVNAKTVNMSASPEMRRALDVAKVVVLGVAPTGPVINRVEDVYSRTENSLMTPGRNLRIYGQRLRIAGDNTDKVGVWFISAGDNEGRTRIDDRDLVDNDPSQLNIIVPSLPAGNYYLEVVTQSSSNNQTFTKEPRSYRFELMLTIE